jgi:hypothetical protein
MDFSASYPIIQWNLDNSTLFKYQSGSMNDSGNGFKLQIIQGSELLIPTTEQSFFYFEKEDNTVGHIDGKPVDDYFLFDLTNQVYAVAGEVKCNFQITDNIKWRTSPRFYITVDENNIQNSIESTNDFISFQSTLNKVGDLTTDIKTLEATITSNEEARNLFENYDNTKAYVVGNKVSYLGSSYVCKVNSTGNIPTDENYWVWDENRCHLGHRRAFPGDHHDAPPDPTKTGPGAQHTPVPRAVPLVRNCRRVKRVPTSHAERLRFSHLPAGSRTSRGQAQYPPGVGDDLQRVAPTRGA